jgi:hypothetical protein
MIIGNCLSVLIATYASPDGTFSLYPFLAIGSRMTIQAAPDKTALFNPFNGHLEQLFGLIDIGDLGLPDIQRPFVWKDAKVRDLFDSIYRGYPIGSYLFWRNTVAGRAHHIGTTQKQHDDPALLIIDGQQRLTALYAVFRNQEVKDEHYDNRKIVIAFNPVSDLVAAK